MIRHLKYKEIDFSQYKKCIDNAVQKNFYAQKEILDILCVEWELLIFGDYDYVMPIPIRKKFGLTFVLMPLFCQQLGVFGFEKNQKMEDEFRNYLIKKFRIMYYAFNFHNQFSETLKTKKNYFIQKQEYLSLRKNYFKGRKSTVKTAQYLTFNEVELFSVEAFIKNNFKGLDKITDLNKFFEYIHFLNKKKKLRLFGSFKEENLTNIAILIDEDDSYSLLGLLNDDNFRQDNGASFLIDKILQDHILSKNFDFMGGTIRGIEIFFKSFGAELQEYVVIENSKKDLLKNLLKK